MLELIGALVVIGLAWMAYQKVPAVKTFVDGILVKIGVKKDGTPPPV